MRALITGATGFTGQYLARTLVRKGYEVFGVAQTETFTSNVSKTFTADLTNADQMVELIRNVKPDIVAHLAAISFVPHGSIDEIYHTNIVGTRNLLEALSTEGTHCRSILLTSSANIYGNSADGILTETSPPAPANDYAVSKLAMEYMAGLYKSRLPIVIARPFNYTGIGQALHFVIPKIVDHFQKNAPSISLGNLDVARDFSDVRTVVDIYSQLLELSSAIGNTFNICSGNAYSLRDVLDMMNRITGHSIEVVIDPAFVRANEVKILKGSREKLETLLGNINNYKLQDTLEWMFLGK